MMWTELGNVWFVSMIEEGTYDDTAQDSWWWRGRDLILSRLVDLEGVILDVGCGNAPHPGTIPVDAHPIVSSFEKGVQADAAKLPFQSDSVDLCLALDLLEHVKTSGLVVADFYRVLGPGKRLVITVPAHKWLWGFHDERLGHLRRYTRPEIRALLEQAGFRVEVLSHFGGLILPGQLFVRRGMQSINGATDVPGWLDWVLYQMLAIDAQIVPYVSIPLGSSIIAVARKPSRYH